MSEWQKNLRQHLKKRQLTQEDLANKLGVTQGAVGHWLNGRRTIDLVTLEKIAAILHIPTYQLLYPAKTVSEQAANYSVESQPVY